MITTSRFLLVGALVFAVGLIGALATAGPTSAAERVHYIAAEQVAWDYAPLGRNEMMGRAFNDDEVIFVTTAPERIGRTYLKVVFREYADATFTRPKQRAAAWAHLGVLGPVIHAEVGDRIRVEFKNKADRAYSMHPHGVFYAKSSEGAPYNDGTTGADKADDVVPAGGSHTYLWEVPERAGPGPNDPSSIAWLYHSHTDEVKDTNSGLVGALIITAKGQARADGTPLDVDREFVTLFTVFDENQSWLLEDNIETYADPDAVDQDDEDFAEGNLMHGINGFLFGNLPGLEMKRCQKTRWYVLALGTEVDLHTPHWHGNTGLMNSRRVDTVELVPASMRVVDIRPDNPGMWMFHCHVNDHLTAGMTSLYRVLDSGDGDCPA